MKLGFIGTGNLASAIIKGIVSSKALEANLIWAYDIYPEKPAKCAEKFGINIAQSADYIAREMDVVLIAVKPADFPNLLTNITDSLKKNNPLIISTAAGTSLKYISSFLNYDPSLVRIMPNITQR
jgi:pyrroline-5-carboxylate reductase